MKLLTTFRNFFKKPEEQRAEPVTISAPVQEIITSLSEPKRWKLTQHPDSGSFHRHCYHKFTALDTKTGESIEIKSEGTICAQYAGRRITFPRYFSANHLPTWLTFEERKAIKAAVDAISAKLAERFTLINDRRFSKTEKQAQANKDKERQRLVDLYC